MRFRWRSEIFPILCILIMLTLAVIAWPQAPDQIPIHWGLNGEPDNYAGKFFGLLIAPLIALGIYLLFLVLPKIDPGGANYEKFWRRFLLIRNIIIVVLLCIKLVTFLWILGIEINMSMAVFLIVGVLLMVLGNYMGKLRPTWFVGIRSPWTLSSEESWDKTHRVGGKLFVIIGLMTVIAGLLQETWAFYTAGISVGVVILYLNIYSYLVWKRDPNAMSFSTKASEKNKENQY